MLFVVEVRVLGFAIVWWFNLFDVYFYVHWCPWCEITALLLLPFVLLSLFIYLKCSWCWPSLVNARTCHGFSCPKQVSIIYYWWMLLSCYCDVLIYLLFIFVCVEVFWMFAKVGWGNLLVVLVHYLSWFARFYFICFLWCLCLVMFCWFLLYW